MLYPHRLVSRLSLPALFDFGRHDGGLPAAISPELGARLGSLSPADATDGKRDMIIMTAT